MAQIRINQNELNRYFNKLANEIAAEARRLAPVNQGDLQRSINVVGNNKIVVDAVDSSGGSYAASVEYGRKPGGRTPPGGPGSRLAIWAGTPGNAVWQLARAIAEKGIKPRPFFWPAVRTVAERHFKNVRMR
jgi:hypothetical protein